MPANLQSQSIIRVVDDDPDVRRSWKFVLEGEGWNVLTYASALEFLEKDSREFLEKRYSVSEAAGQSGRIFCVNPSSV